MSYNGVGLSSAKGSGTSGFIQRNLGNIKTRENQETKGKHFYKRQLNEKKNEKIEKLKKISSLPLDKDIHDHQLKKEIEIKVMEYRDKMEEEQSDLDDGEIDKLVDAYRIKLMKNKKITHKQKGQPYNIHINPFDEKVRIKQNSDKDK
jgi:hypothetical protein